jgi:iron-sulfur cluster repair protein YtfE (RIC family)
VRINIESSKGPSDIADLLLACHDRIRFFIDLARRIAESHDASAEEVQQAAGSVIRYFSESLPLHVADEEESILPRLTGRAAGLDAALQTLCHEHREHELRLAQLIDTCRILIKSPEGLDEVRERLASVAAGLELDLVQHLQGEEEIVIPAIRSLLTEEDLEALLREFRDRRAE